MECYDKVHNGYKNTTTIKLTIGQKTAFINSKAIQLTVIAQVINGSIIIPLRFVFEAHGADFK